jgi:hypothetical protein
MDMVTTGPGLDTEEPGRDWFIGTTLMMLYRIRESTPEVYPPDCEYLAFHVDEWVTSGSLAMPSYAQRWMDRRFPGRRGHDRIHRAIKHACAQMDHLGLVSFRDIHGETQVLLTPSGLDVGSSLYYP